MIQTKGDSQDPSACNGGGDQSLHTGLLNLLSEEEEDAESISPNSSPASAAARSRWSKVHVIRASHRFRLTLRPTVFIDSEVPSGNIEGESLHTGLLNLKAESSPVAARSRWSKVHVIIRAFHRFFLTRRPPKPSSSSLPYISVPQVDNDIRINIQEETESVIPLADTGGADAIGLSRNSSSPSSSDNRTINVGDASASNRSLVEKIMRGEDLNTLRNCGSDHFIASVFNSDLEFGLGSANLQEQEVITTAKSLASYFIHETNSWNIMLLVTAGLLSMATGMLDYGPNSGWHDSLAIFVAILFLIMVPSLAKFHQAKKLEKKKMQKEKVGVIREGSRQEIAASTVVAGDLVILEKGIRVPGDGLLVHGSDDGLDFDERPNKPFLRYGAKVVCGTGRMMVTSVGSDTKMGELMRNVNCDLKAPTCLQSWILGPMSYMDTVSLCIAILVIIVICIRFRHKNHDKSLPEMKGKPPLENLMRLFIRSLVRPRGLVSFLGTAISTLVMVFQQGVPLAITLALSYWNQKVESPLTDDHHHAHPQNLSACATMGFANVICFNISGEMVLQTMEIGKFFVGHKEFTLGEESNDAVRLLLQRNFVSINKCRDSRSPLDSLLESWFQPRMGVSKEEFSANTPFAHKVSKSNSGKEVLIKHGQDTLHLRGPGKRILERCSHYYVDDGRSVKMLETDRKLFNQSIENMVHEHLHPIALAYKKTADQELNQCNLIFIAMLGVKFQEEAISTIETFSKEGVSIKIISEDKLDEVKSILDQHSIFGSNFGMLEGETFRSLEDNVRNERINYKIMVMEKFTAPDKLKLVQCLKQEGNIVTFCGGGDQTSEDAPAMIEADVGLVYGNCNTEFLKEASDIIVITRGRGRGLSSIYSLWNFHRCISNNLQKFTAVQLIVYISGLIINSVSSLVLGESTITTIQVIWANAVICILGGLMMIIKLPICEMKVASDRLLGSRTNPLTKGMWMNVMIQVLYQVFILMFFLFEGHITRRLLGINHDVKNTFVFNSFILCQVVNVLNTMQLDKKKVFLITMDCYIFLASLMSILVVQILLVQFAGCLANFSKLNFVQWVECFILALFPWVSRFILKSVSNRGALFVTSMHPCSSQLPYIGAMFSMFF